MTTTAKLPECTCFAGSNVFARHLHEASCPCAAEGYLPPQPRLTDRERGYVDLLESAWGVIANVSESDWTKQTREWQQAAAGWRERYHGALNALPKADQR